jgi:hypothetical protein
MSGPLMPVEVTVAFAHAEVQVIAEDAGVDLLHIKGPALDESLRRPWPDDITGRRRESIDADVLVRPSHVARLLNAMKSSGWRRLYDFADGSAFEHAATWARDDLASVDVHRHFPGIEGPPEAAFDVLWSERRSADIGGVECAVPSVTGQRLVILIHAARGRSGRDVADRHRSWLDLDQSAKEEIEHLAEQVGATVALYAATDRLEQVRGHRTYPLWRHLTSEQTSLTGLWWARVRSAPNAKSSVRLGWRMVAPNVRRMETVLGRPPTRSEVAGAYRDRLLFGLRSVKREMKRRVVSR